MTEIPQGQSGEGRRARRVAGSTPSPAAGGRAAARKNTKNGGRGKKPRRVLRIVAYTSAGAILLTAGVGAYAYQKLNGNIHSAPLFAGTSGDAGHETPDAFGRTPINILVIGSDTRDNAADCAIGGDCGSGANADVEMVLHVSADRSNATVMSVPRDTVTQLPGCTDTQNHTSMKAHTDMINSTLDYGPGCTVAAVHQLTGIPIDHFITVDFSGVVQMSDAVGGVPICVSDNVYDPYSHLKLKKGDHTLKGMAALAFVRSRHGFGDGSDLGRTVAQHMFLGSMVRQLKSAGTLTNPSAVWSLANAATQALTVDTGLSGIPQLMGLANDLNKVPSDRITFTTMQNEPDPSNNARIIVAPAAQNLFKTIINDQSLTTGSGDKSSAAAQATGAAAAPAPAPAPTSAAPKPAGAPAADIAVQIKNSSGVSGRGTVVLNSLIAQGYSSRSTDVKGILTSRTTVSYTAGREADAKEVAASLGLPASAVVPGEGSGITLIIGSDWTTGTTFGGSTGTTPSGGGAPAAPAPVDTQAALNNASAQTADDSSKCAQVGTQRTVEINGVGMTPIQAYSKSPDVPDSAP
ncbi:LCP family protein required for cell wall assembly [Kitasatospora sp. MAP12-15]|uniref:LCP family protein n=1 Tax=unclassified Kitasatospora TaxID=2633591 RepID=UPI0024751729|nr:LCP family protein [Kitasatospora sp. MAP12-44]MDH6113814.1 LCP family protein required for cell wall assembly [Kitasatospora sp. MAP12-44]